MYFSTRMLITAASLGVSAGAALLEQQGVGAPGGRGGNTAPPSNPQPRPSQPASGTPGSGTGPGANQPGNGPGAESGNGTGTNPNGTATTNTGNGQGASVTGNNPGAPVVTTQGPAGQQAVNGQPGAAGTIAGNGVYMRPFAFANPAYEARFNESVQRLNAMEQRMNTNNATLTKRLGEIRSMTPERQNAAMFDLVQQMLMEQAQLNQYLVQARTAWTGDLTNGTQQANAGNTTPSTGNVGSGTTGAPIVQTPSTTTGTGATTPNTTGTPTNNTPGNSPNPR